MPFARHVVGKIALPYMACEPAGSVLAISNNLCSVLCCRKSQALLFWSLERMQGSFPHCFYQFLVSGRHWLARRLDVVSVSQCVCEFLRRLVCLFLLCIVRVCRRKP